jgi:hypothetical protein
VDGDANTLKKPFSTYQTNKKILKTLTVSQCQPGGRRCEKNAAKKDSFYYDKQKQTTLMKMKHTYHQSMRARWTAMRKKRRR